MAITDSVAGDGIFDKDREEEDGLLNVLTIFLNIGKLIGKRRLT